MTGKEINDIRKNLGLTHARFANLLGVSVYTLRDWMYRDVKPMLIYEKIFEMLSNQDVIRSVLDVLSGQYSTGFMYCAARHLDGFYNEKGDIVFLLLALGYKDADEREW